jgi:hypothetical protein
MSEPAPSSAYHPRCRNLCSKAMHVYGESFEDDPEYQMGMTEFWCVLTSKGQGPDNNEVSLPMCSDRERGCFKEF